MKISFSKRFTPKQPQTDEIWSAKKYDDGDPFPKPILEVVKIIDCKSDWVRFSIGKLYLNNAIFCPIGTGGDFRLPLQDFYRSYRFNHMDGDKSGLEDWNKSI